MTDDDYRLDDAEARTLRATLVAELAAAGAFPDPRWRQVFKTVPRHVFVPHVFVPADTAGTYRPLDGTDPARRGEWLRHVYADDIAITQLDGDEKAWKAAMRDGTVTAEAMTCTSSQPALMAGMLAELGVADGAPAALLDLADGVYATGLNETEGYGMYITDSAGRLVDAVAAYDVTVDQDTPCRLGEETRNWTRNDLGESYTRAQFLGDNELDFVVTAERTGRA